jgi:dihydrolipoamide dehydrogenase
MLNETREVELVVVGAGPGGYAAAFHAADLGMKVVMVDAGERPGGTCLHIGCIPSKALLHIARIITEAREIEPCGIRFGSPQIDLDVLRAWKERVVQALSNGLAELCKRRRVERIKATARFQDSSTLILDPPIPPRLRFKQAILATGSRPAAVRGLDLASSRVMDSTAALRLEALPATLLVIGGGYIGLELGTAYSALGSRVTLIEMTDGLLPGVDRDLVMPLQKQLRRTFHAIHLKSTVTRMVETENGVLVTMEEGVAERKQTYDRVLVSVGRRPNTTDLGLEHTNIEIDRRGFIRVDDQLRTGEKNIYAVGDIAGEPMLAHKATHEARVAVEAIVGKRVSLDCRTIPAVVFTDPEIAWCGLTEDEAGRTERPVRVSTFPWSASGRAVTLGRTEGHTKLLVDPTNGRVLGAGIVGVGAGELIAECALGIEMGVVSADLAMTIHPHPTLTETIHEAAELDIGSATHLVRHQA